MRFTVGVRGYAGGGFLYAKRARFLLGTLAALPLHGRHGFLPETAGKTLLAADAILSLLCWPTARVCGRLIAFAGD